MVSAFFRRWRILRYPAAVANPTKAVMMLAGSGTCRGGTTTGGGSTGGTTTGGGLTGGGVTGGPGG